MQSKTLLKTFIAASLLAVSSLAASAATVTFTFDSTDTTASFTQGGLGLTVSSATFVNSGGNARTLTDAPNTSLAFTADGLGMMTPGNNIDSVRTTDDGREAVKFTFDSVVKLLSVTFTQRETPSGDLVALGTGLVFVDGLGNGSAPTNSNSTVFSVMGTTDFSGKTYSGLSIGIASRPQVAPYLLGDFFISSIEVEYTPDVAPVPVPAAGLMLGSLVLLPLLRRKRRAA